jgi:molybdopterin-guanine dinucleotide biosynthesis protein A
VFLMACDLPLVPGSLIRRIVASWPPVAVAAVPGSPGPLGFEPLCAAYDTDILETVEQLLQDGRRSMESVLEALSVAPIPIEQLGVPDHVAASFLNVNTEDLADQAEALILGERR